MRKVQIIGARGRRLRRLLAVAGVGALLVTMAACGDDSADDDSQTEETVAADAAADLLGPEDAASGEPVKIGLISDGRTDAFDNTDELRAGQAAAEYLNQHQAGIGGRPIEIVPCETGSDPAGATDCGNQMVEAGVVGVALSQSAVAESFWEPVHAAGIPTFILTGFGEPLQKDTETTFLNANPVATFFGLPIATAEAEDAKKVAFVVIDVPQAVDIIESDAAETMGKADLEYEVVRVPIGTADMTVQMQQVVDSGAGVVHVIGNDSFCIAAFQGLTAVAYDGAITAVSQCITDATREAMPGELEGINMLATLAVGDTDDTGYQLYQAVMGTYGEDVTDVDNFVAVGGYASVMTLATALEGISGDITTATVAETIQGMAESEIPVAAGATFQCGGSADPEFPAVCTNQWLRAVLDADGEPASYSVEDSTDIL